VNNCINLDFKRQLVGVYLHEWNNLLSIINTVRINSSLPDICTWRWGVSGKFLVHSFYEWLSFGGVISDEYDIIWKSKIPLKIKKNYVAC
jgi:hypothetical protein